MGYEMAHSIAMAMEQMNQFQYKGRGGSMRSCGIRVYATQAEFDELEGEKDESVKGFFVPLENRVATYDPRAEWQPLGELWSTLFHEASHQFTEATTTNLMPGWLNEGTASYFEGATLLPSGQVVANQVPTRRLEELRDFLEKGSPTLKEVVSYFEEGSYDVTYYPFGWGLVYFIQNYEDERSERVYVPIYRDYMQTYTKGGNHDVVGRFVEYFVERAQQPGIETFEQFEARWKQWIQDLADVHFGPSEKADVLLARARKQVAAREVGGGTQPRRKRKARCPRRVGQLLHHARTRRARWATAADRRALRLHFPPRWLPRRCSKDYNPQMRRRDLGRGVLRFGPRRVPSCRSPELKSLRASLGR